MAEGSRLGNSCSKSSTTSSSSSRWDAGLLQHLLLLAEQGQAGRPARSATDRSRQLQPSLSPWTRWTRLTPEVLAKLPPQKEQQELRTALPGRPRAAQQGSTTGFSCRQGAGLRPLPGVAAAAGGGDEQHSSAGVVAWLCSQDPEVVPAECTALDAVDAAAAGTAGPALHPPALGSAAAAVQAANEDGQEGSVAVGGGRQQWHWQKAGLGRRQQQQQQAAARSA